MLCTFGDNNVENAKILASAEDATKRTRRILED